MKVRFISKRILTLILILILFCLIDIMSYFLFLVERRRRENINQIICELATIVPDCHPGQAKGSILRKTADYVRTIQTKIAKGEIVCRSSDGGFTDPTSAVKRALEEEEEERSAASKKMKG